MSCKSCPETWGGSSCERRCRAPAGAVRRHGLLGWWCPGSWGSHAWFAVQRHQTGKGTTFPSHGDSVLVHRGWCLEPVAVCVDLLFAEPSSSSPLQAITSTSATRICLQRNR